MTIVTFVDHNDADFTEDIIYKGGTLRKNAFIDFCRKDFVERSIDDIGEWEGAMWKTKEECESWFDENATIDTYEGNSIIVKVPDEVDDFNNELLYTKHTL